MTKDEQIKALRAQVKILTNDVKDVTAAHEAQRKVTTQLNEALSVEEKAYKQLHTKYGHLLAAWILVRDTTCNTQVLLDQSRIVPNITITSRLKDRA